MPLAVRPAAAVGAAAVLATAAGDGFVAAVLLAVAAGGWAGLAAGLAVAATVARWGTADLGAVAGDQDVLGIAVAVGPTQAAVSSVLAALSLLGIAAVGDEGIDRRLLAVPAGLGAGALAAGPASTSAADLGARAGVAVLCVVLAAVLARDSVRRRIPRFAPAIVSLAALVAAW